MRLVISVPGIGQKSINSHDREPFAPCQIDVGNMKNAKEGPTYKSLEKIFHKWLMILVSFKSHTIVPSIQGLLRRQRQCSNSLMFSKFSCDVMSIGGLVTIMLKKYRRKFWLFVSRKLGHGNIEKARYAPYRWFQKSRWMVFESFILLSYRQTTIYKLLVQI